MKEISEPRHLEPHLNETSSMRDFVFGFGDGVNTSLGLAAGVGGAAVSSDLIILATLVAMFTGAKAMAVQNYLAVKSQRELLTSEINRENWEIENKPKDERKEIEDIYKAKGFTGKDLEMIVDKITSDKKVWLDTMLTEELNLNLEILGHPIKSALRMFGAFLVGAVKSRMANSSLIKGGIEMAGLGTGIALIGYGVGSELASIGIVNV